MATKELSIEERLQNLWDLQQIDNELRSIQILKGELPQEVQDLEDELAGLDKRLAKIDEGIEELQTDVKNHKANIKEANALIEKYNGQLDNVKNNREYEALTKEIEMQELEIKLSEKRIGEAENKQVIRNETREATSERRAKIEEAYTAKKDQLSTIIKKTEKEEKTLQKKADGVREKISERYLKAYDKIRKAYKNGLSVVTVQRNACGGCFNKIPPQVQIEIQQRKKIIGCEHCGRVLVDDKIANVEG